MKIFEIQWKSKKNKNICEIQWNSINIHEIQWNQWTSVKISQQIAKIRENPRKYEKSAEGQFEFSWCLFTPLRGPAHPVNDEAQSRKRKLLPLTVDNQVKQHLLWKMWKHVRKCAKTYVELHMLSIMCKSQSNIIFWNMCVKNDTTYAKTNATLHVLSIMCTKPK